MIKSSILGLFESFCNHKMFIKLNLPIIYFQYSQKDEKDHRGHSLYILGYYVVFLDVFILNIFSISRYCCLYCF